MSRTRPTERERGVLTIACPFCKANPDEWCMTEAGRWVSPLHATRWYDYWEKPRS